MASGTLIAPAGDPSVADISGAAGQYRCECGHVLRVSGGGRHRVYFQPDNVRLDDPVMNRLCPDCGKGLPGKNRP
jgi:hypothetical protein